MMLGPRLWRNELRGVALYSSEGAILGQRQLERHGRGVLQTMQPLNSQETSSGKIFCGGSMT
jgi:hypothetical protein